MKREIVLSEKQIQVAHQTTGSVFLTGKAGAGKTTTGAAHLRELYKAGIEGHKILILVPHRKLMNAYFEALKQPSILPGARSKIVTIGGLAKQMVDTSWSLIGGLMHFARPDLPPVFLTHEASVYYMSKIVEPMMQQGRFIALNVRPNRIYGQLIDNLNKAALVGFPIQEVSQRLLKAWGSNDVQMKSISADIDQAISQFRALCLQNNFLDFSLQTESFMTALDSLDLFKAQLRGYSHIIADNIEENPPVAHDLLRFLARGSENMLLIHDEDAGVRTYMSVDTVSAAELIDVCDTKCVLDESFVESDQVNALEVELRIAMGKRTNNPHPASLVKRAVVISSSTTYLDMLDDVVAHIAELVNGQSVPAEEIAILAPFVPDALHSMLKTRLENEDIEIVTHRPSSPLANEAAVKALLIFARLAHPQWRVSISSGELVFALSKAISGLDPIRSHLLVKCACSVNSSGELIMLPFDQIPVKFNDYKERITFTLGEKYDQLRMFIEEVRTAGELPLDYFFTSIFGELLSMPGFGYHTDKTDAALVAQLIHSAKLFRQTKWPREFGESNSVGHEFVEYTTKGILAKHVTGERVNKHVAKHSVMLVPAYTFLMNNKSVAYQAWLDVGDLNWWQSLTQVLTNPHVLSRQWDAAQLWDMNAEFAVQNTALLKLSMGLLRRCKKGVIVGITETGLGGNRQGSPLLRALGRVMRNVA